MVSHLRTLGLVGLCLLGLAAVPGAATAAEPAYVVRIGGTNVTVNRGGEAVPVRVQMLIAAGEVVMAGENSFVEVSYLADGCTLRVANGRSIVVASASPCGVAEETQAALAEQAPPKPAERSAAAAPREDGVARVTRKTGPLTRVNFGEGLVELRSGADLKAGHTVFAGQGSTITLYYYKADCEYTVPPENYLEIREEAPCRKAQAPAKPGSPADAQLGLAIGAAALVGGGGAIAFLVLAGEEEDEDQPATPN